MCIYIYIIICTNIPGWSVAPGWSSFPVLRSTWTGQKPWSATSSGSGWGDLGEPNDWSPSGCVNGIYGIHWLIQINHHSPKIGNSLDISLFRWPIAPEAAAREIRQETETAVRPGVPWSTKRQVFGMGWWWHHFWIFLSIVTVFCTLTYLFLATTGDRPDQACMAILYIYRMWDLSTARTATSHLELSCSLTYEHVVSRADTTP